MPVRATKRGAERTPIGGEFDVLICGASFAGLAVARELRATRARVLVLDRYEIGERQTSACAAPTEWLRNLGLESSIRQTFGSLVCHTPARDARAGRSAGRSRRSTTASCASCCGSSAARERSSRPRRCTDGAATWSRPTAATSRAPLIVDALGWRRLLGAQRVQPPNARLSRGLEVHPAGAGDDLELWIDKRVIRAGYGWSFPARDELRVGIGSFDPHDHVKQPTVAARGRARAAARRLPGQLDPAPAPARRPRTAIFFAGDSAGHCLPLTAEGIRTAFYFGYRLRARAARGAGGRGARASRRSSGTGSSRRRTRWKYACMLHVQHAIPKLRPRALGAMARTFERGGPAHWAFRHYLRIAPPEFALPAPAARGAPARDSLAA